MNIMIIWKYKNNKETLKNATKIVTIFSACPTFAPILGVKGRLIYSNEGRFCSTVKYNAFAYFGGLH